MLLEMSGEITPERMKMEPKQKQHPVVDVTGDGRSMWSHLIPDGKDRPRKSE